ncbi:MAG: hypothetical protein ACTSYG_08560 [Candidatus Heimdallarchaeota archaeon]
MKVVSKVYPEGIKCPGCNWNVTKLYAFEGEDVNTKGVCGHCFSELMEAIKEV